jgi:hypothetical protein
VNVAGTITGGLLDVEAQNGSTLITDIDSLTANISGPGESLTVNEDDDLIVDAGNITTANGAISITLLDLDATNQPGNLTGSGDINAGTANVTLNATDGGITPTGTITGNLLDLSAQNGSSVNTNVSSITAAITASGNLAVNEVNDLAIDGGNVTTANGAIDVTAGGNINGTGLITAGGVQNVTLNATGGITLNSNSGQVSGNLLTLKAGGNTNVDTNVTSITANIAGSGSLFVLDVDDLVIDAGNVTTANGSIDIGANGKINGTGFITAGGNQNIELISISSITLNSAAGQITGNKHRQEHITNKR